MRDEVQKKVVEYRKVHREKRKWQKLMGSLAVLVIFATVYALTIPAITMETVTYCGLSEHTHSEACYTRTLICGQEESAGHVHDDSCYESTAVLVCGQTEGSGHTHSEACYTQILTCLVEESAGHVHSDACYATTTVLVCGQTEDAESGHVHDDSCYETVTTLNCGQEESAGHVHTGDCYTSVLSCGLEEGGGHTHGPECYETVTALICQQEETAGHTHTDECYEVTQTCGYETEHIHTLACYSNPEADLETSDDWERTMSDVELTGVWAKDLLAVAESQLDYNESTKNYVMDEEGTVKGYTRYGAWYGQPYEDWSAMFVSFCLNYAQIPEKAVPRSDDCQLWIERLSGQAEGYEGYGLYAGADDWTPVAGDLVFLDLDEDRLADHVGIVAEYTIGLQGGDEIEIIAGDFNDRVERATYELGDGRILGYGCLPENPEGGDLTEEASESETETITEGISESETGESETETITEEASESETSEPETETATEEASESETNEPETETVTEEASESEPGESETETITEGTSESETNEPETETITETASESEPDEPETETATEEESESETSEPATESETEEDSELTTEEESEAETESELESETEADPDEVWRAALEQVELTGVWSEDLVAVAASQLGYAESVTDCITTEAGEIRGYTCYGAWYGEDYRYADWDALFVSYCLSRAGIAEAYFPRAAEASAWINLLSGQAEGYDLYEENQGYDGLDFYEETEGWSPSAGALIFLDTNGDGGADRVGIVAEAAADEAGCVILKTIQGDLDDMVQYASYRADDAAVLGYARLPDDPVNDGMTLLTAWDGIETTQVEEYMLWLYQNTLANSTYSQVADYSNCAWTNDNLYGARKPIGDALQVTGTNTYLIPVKYFTEAYRDAYVFSEDDTDYCPFTYKPDASSDGTERSKASYVYLEDQDTEPDNSASGWYVQVEDTGNYTDDYPHRSNVYYTYVETTPITAFRLWQKVNNTIGGTTLSTTVGNYDGTAALTDVLNVTGTNYYLIPVGYFIENYREYGYAFNVAEECPFQYAPDATASTSNLTAASYMKVKGSWYVMVQDTGTYDPPPRSNVYYDSSVFATEPVSAYWLWLQQIEKGGTAETAKKLVGYSGNTDWGDTEAALTDVLHVLNTNYYLIPVKYFIDAYSGNGFSFDETDTDYCPLQYAPNASPGTTGLTFASYSYIPGQVGDTEEETDRTAGWYVMVQDTTNLEPHRSNVYYDPPGKLITDTVSPSGTVINLFDYWTTEPIENDVTDQSRANSGINYGHALKFTPNGAGSTESNANKWTRDKTVYREIVNNTLTEGYPSLSNTATFMSGSETISSTESLKYLFDPTHSNAYRSAYTNVKGLLQVDSEGYYYYNSSENYAEYDEAANSFNVYDEWAVTYTPSTGNKNDGQFFPFNEYRTVNQSTDAGSDSMNHYFGMTLTARFIQRYNGYTDVNYKTPMSFEFAGDDDVWIFIDDVLVADLGGIHDEASVKIDFSTGKVMVNDVQQTTLKEAFTAAGKSEDDDTKWNGNTFANDTYHTLKFFYMERGSYASDLHLKYNLSDYPPTAIYKVNQYGEAVAGATFAVYAANSSYQYLDGPNGSVVSLNDSYTYNENWDMVDSAGMTVKALYRGVTDRNGEMVFVDKDGVAYTLSELEALFGDHFILKEVDVPEGYRLVSDEIKLRIYGSKLLLCDNTYQSGVYSSPSLQVAAPNTLKKANLAETINYSDGATSKGTLFAVVLKYTGTGTDGLENEANWKPVYGTAMGGYELMDTGDGFINAVIETAKRIEADSNMGSPVFKVSAGGQMQATLENLPGDIKNYYYMLGEDKSKTEYTVAYYWTEGSLAKATSTNTVRIDADASGHGFSRTFGATIAVPNLVNRMFAQKLDENGNLVNGAVFALYEVEETESDTTSGNSSTIYYKSTDSSLIYLYPDDGGKNDTGGVAGDNKGGAKLKGSDTGTWEADGKTGIITVKIGTAAHTIKPVSVEQTLAASNSSNPSGENGTATFTNLNAGAYYLREIAAPHVYELNPAEVMVLITEDAIYANAGTKDDGVTVGRGPGYVVSTLYQFASEGKLDNTLTWIYERMRISEVSTTFKAYENNAYAAWGYLTTNNTAKSGTESNALTTYLVYDTSADANTLFNYTVNAAKYTGDTAAINRRLYNTVGWGYYEIYQDYDYGVYQAALNNAAYTDLRGQEIAALFSRSTYVRVADKYERTHNLFAQKLSESGDLVDDAVFALYDVEEQPDGKIYYKGKKKDGQDEVLIYLYPDDGGADDVKEASGTGTENPGEDDSGTGGENLGEDGSGTGGENPGEDDSGTGGDNPGEDGSGTGGENPGEDGSGTGGENPGEDNSGEAENAKKVAGDNRGKAKIPDCVKTGIYEVNSTDGTITVTIDGAVYIIEPVDTQKTMAASIAGNLSGENGTATFKAVEEGTYYLREICAPTGYLLNPTEVMVLVTENSVYANAGTSTDGVTVAHDPGYALNTTYSAETLRWIYGKLRISGESPTFHAYDKDTDGTPAYTQWNYLVEKHTNESGSEVKDDVTAWLVKQDSTTPGTLFEYTVNTGRAGAKADTSAAARKLYTTEGWAFYEIYQDTDYGEGQITTQTYMDLNGRELSDIYNRSTFVQVTDKYIRTDITVKKVDSINTDKTLSGAEFVLYYKGEDRTKYYYSNGDWIKTSAESNESETENSFEAAYVQTTGADGIISFAKLKDGVYYLKEVKAPSGYNRLSNEITITIRDGRIIQALLGTTEVNISTNGVELTVPNSSGYVLPSTGGRGTLWYTFSGLALMSGVLLYWIYRWRRKGAISL